MKDKDCAVDIVYDLLGLVMTKPPSKKTIRSWTPQQRLTAENWAARVHLRASDNPVRVPPKPKFIS